MTDRTDDGLERAVQAQLERLLAPFGLPGAGVGVPGGDEGVDLPAGGSAAISGGVMRPAAGGGQTPGHIFG